MRKKNQKRNSVRLDKNTQKNENAFTEKVENKIFREINETSFNNNFMILIQHYKKQVAQNPPKSKIL